MEFYNVMIRLIFGILVCLVSACSPSIQESNSKNIKLHAQVQKNIFALDSTGKPLSVQAHSNELKPLKSYPLQPLTGRVILQPQQFIAQKLLEVSSRTMACSFQILNHVKPERVTANPPYTRDQNGASFCCYGKQQGLRHNRVYDLLEDSNRAVWMATNEGLVRFNGFFYDHYNRHSGLPGNYIRCLIRDRNQHIWCGSEEGHLVWIKNNQLGILKITDFNLPPVKCLYEDADSTIWIGTEKGLYKLNSKGVEAITQFSSSVIASISGFRNQVFITSNEWGLAVYRAGKFYTYDTRLTGIQVQGHFVNSNQEVLAYSSEKRLIKIDRKSTRLNSSHIPLSRMPSSA